MMQVRKNVLTMAVLAAIAGAFGLYAFYGVAEPERKKDAEKAEAEKIISFGQAADAEDAGTRALKFTRLEVTAKGETTTLEKQDDKWQLLSPVKAPADAFTVDGITSQLQTAKFKDTVEESPSPEALKRYGLDTPRFIVKATVAPESGGGAKEVTLRGGIENTFDGSVYVQRDGDPKVFSVQGGVRWSLEKNTFDLRDKQVLGVPEKDVTGIEISVFGDKGQKTGGLVAKRVDEKTWRLESPEAVGADAQAVTTFLGGLKNHRATAFRTDSSEERAKLGFDKPVAQATFTLTKGEPIQIALVSQQTEGRTFWFALRTQGADTTLAEVPEQAINEFTKDPMLLRDKSVLSFEKDKVARIAFEKADGAKIVVERMRSDAGNTEDWRVVEPQTGPAKKWKLSSILWSLGSLRATEFGEEAPKSWTKWGLDKPERRVSLLDSNGAVLATLAVGKDVQGLENTKFVRGTRDQVLQMETTRLAEFPETVADVLEGAAPAPTAAGDAGI